MPSVRLTRERRRELTREALLEAATDVFAAKGYEAASLEEIAAAAGFTRGAIYGNFTGKEDLYIAVSERFNDRGFASFASVLAGGDGAGHLDVVALAAAWRALLTAERGATALLTEFRLFALRNENARLRLVDQGRRNRVAIADFIRAAERASGRALDIEPDALAGIVGAMTDGLALHAMLGHDDPLVYEAFLRLIIGAVVAPADGPQERQHPTPSA